MHPARRAQRAAGGGDAPRRRQAPPPALGRAPRTRPRHTTGSTDLTPVGRAPHRRHIKDGTDLMAVGRAPRTPTTHQGQHGFDPGRSAGLRIDDAPRASQIRPGRSAGRRDETDRDGEHARTTAMLVAVVICFVAAELPQGVLAFLESSASRKCRGSPGRLTVTCNASKVLRRRPSSAQGVQRAS